MKPLTQEQLKQALTYDADTGLFRRARSGGGMAKGSTAGTLHRLGYVQIIVNGCAYQAHRLAWLYETGDWPPDEIDHINRKRADNKFCNLRLATSYENKQNRETRIGGSGVRGCYLHKPSGLFQAKIRADGKTRSLGYFKTAAEAGSRYAQEAKAVHSHCAVW